MKTAIAQSIQAQKEFRREVKVSLQDKTWTEYLGNVKANMHEDHVKTLLTTGSVWIGIMEFKLA